MRMYTLNNYKYFSITLYWLDDTTKLTFVVLPSSKTKSGEEKIPYTEMLRQDGSISAFVDVKWRLNIDSGLKDSFGVNIKYEIDSSSMYPFMQAIRTLRTWFTNKQYQNLYIKDSVSGKVTVNKQEYTPIKIQNIYGHTLEFDPCVNFIQLDSRYELGVNIYVNGLNEPCFMSVLNFLNFAIFIDNISVPNLVMSALSTISLQALVKSIFPDVQQSISSNTQSNKNNNSYFSMVGAKKV